MDDAYETCGGGLSYAAPGLSESGVKGLGALFGGG